MSNDEIMMLAKKHHITDAYEYGSGVSDEDVVAFFNSALQTKQAELTDEEIGQFKGEWYRGDYASFYDLVRAILRKAQEK